MILPANKKLFKVFLTGLVWVVFVYTGYGQLPFTIVNLPPEHQQLVVVPGKNGMGWGRGLHAPVPAGPEKAEGDGKAPAGIFEFGEAFGYGTDPPVNLKLPYRQSTARDYWIDATASPAYNTWVSIPEDKENIPEKYWNSFERMKRRDHLYELGLVIKHNMEPAVPGKGSAIFMHIWRSPGAPTLGCTAMSKEDLVALLSWLDPEKHPLLIQAPKQEIDQLWYKVY